MPARRRSSRVAKMKAGGQAGASPTGFSFSSPGAAAGQPAAAMAPKFSFGAAAPVGATTAGNGVFQFGASKFLVLLTDDLVLRVMNDTGPRWTRLLGGACKRLHALSTLDELWKVFWMRRATVPSFFPPAVAVKEEEGEKIGTAEGEGWDAPSAPAAPTYSGPYPTAAVGEQQWRETVMPDTGIAAAYARLHAKPRPPRQAPIKVCDVAGGVSVTMRHIWCCKRDNRTPWGAPREGDREWAICGNDASVWCDWPQCPEARCRQHEYVNEDDFPSDDRDYKPAKTLRFASCSWCSKQACPAHAAECGWRRCDLCIKSSCPDCAGEVHLDPSGVCEFHTAKKFRMFSERCAKFVCHQCASIVKKTGMFKVKVEAAPPNALAATNRRDRAYWQSPESKQFPVVCCGPCSDEACERMLERRAEELKRRRDAAAKMAAIAPSPAASVPDGCPFAFAVGSFHTVDSGGGAGILRFGINSAGHWGGWWQFAPKADATESEPERQPAHYRQQCGEEEEEEEEDESALEEEQDFVGLGPAWEEGQEDQAYCQPRTPRDAGGEPREGCVELDAVAAPGYCFQYQDGRNLATPGTMTLERVVGQQGQALLKGQLLMEKPFGESEKSGAERIYFTGAPLGGVPLERDCTHNTATIQAAETAAATAHLAVKHGRRERMEALAVKYPAWGAQMQYAQGESSDSEIDGLDDSDMVPPWLMDPDGPAQSSNESQSDDSD